MNTPLKLTLVGVTSFAAGAVTAYFVTKKAFATIAQEEIDSVHAMYQLTRKEQSPEEIARHLDKEEALSRLRARISSGEWTSEELSRNNVTLNGEPINLDEEQTPLSIFDEAERAQVNNETAVLNELLEKRQPGLPYVITIDDYHSDEYDTYDKASWKYYEDPEGDHTLLDDADSIIPDIEGNIGDAYNYFGIGSQDKDIVYVRRDEVSMDIEVTRIPMSYVEAIHNVDYDEIDERTARRPLRMPREV